MTAGGAPDDFASAANALKKDHRPPSTIHRRQRRERRTPPHSHKPLTAPPQSSVRDRLTACSNSHISISTHELTQARSGGAGR